MRHLELFAGVGGFRMAMEYIQRDNLMDFEHVGFSEIDKKAVTTYKANFNTEEEVELGDIVSFTKDEANIHNLPDFDIISGGFPCQSFSMMGKKLGFEDERGQMFFRIMDIVHIKHPQYLLLENVKNLLNHDKGETLNRIVYELTTEGYNVFYDIFNTSDFKLPQTRNRIIIFATLNAVPEDFVFSSEVIRHHFELHADGMGINKYDTVLGILENDVDEKYLLSERIKPTLLANGSAGFKSKSDINQLIARPLTASMHKMHRACQDNYYSLEFIDSHGETNAALTMTKEELATIPIRKLTPTEAFRLQGFPNDFAYNARLDRVSDGAMYRQAGNAVSVNTIYAILHYLITQNILV